MNVYSFSFSVYAWIFLSIFEVGSSLECYRCNITVYGSQVYGPCEGIQTLLECLDPAVCITVSYSYKGRNSWKTTKVLKSCYPNMSGEECTHHMADVKSTAGALGGAVSQYSCQTCNVDGCNVKPVWHLSKMETPYMGQAPASATVSFLCLIPFSMSVLV